MTPCRIHPSRPATHVRRYLLRGVPSWDRNSIGIEHLCAACAVQVHRVTGVQCTELTTTTTAAGDHERGAA